MSEIGEHQEYGEQRVRAEAFMRDHVHVPHNLQDLYYEVWRAKAEAQLTAGDKSPAWLRRTFDMGSEFEATIDCYVPGADGSRLRLCGSILLDDRDVGTVVPAEDGSRVPVLERSTEFSPETLAQAIEHIETLAHELTHS